MVGAAGGVGRWYARRLRRVKTRGVVGPRGFTLPRECLPGVRERQVRPGCRDDGRRTSLSGPRRPAPRRATPCLRGPRRRRAPVARAEEWPRPTDTSGTQSRHGGSPAPATAADRPRTGDRLRERAELPPRASLLGQPRDGGGSSGDGDDGGGGGDVGDVKSASEGEGKDGSREGGAQAGGSEGGGREGRAERGEGGRAAGRAEGRWGRSR